MTLKEFLTPFNEKEKITLISDGGTLVTLKTSGELKRGLLSEKNVKASYIAANSLKIIID